LKYLLDTCVISEVVKAKPNQKVMGWLSSQADVDLYLSVVTIGEIRRGIEIARPSNLEAALKYEAWLDDLTAHYGERIVPFDEPAAQAWGRLMVHASGSGIEDAQIAAIASTRGMTVATRNTPDFRPFSVSIFDPF
jgi:predicted nucleic acid-binding protein